MCAFYKSLCLYLSCTVYRSSRADDNIAQVIGLIDVAASAYNQLRHLEGGLSRDLPSLENYDGEETIINATPTVSTRSQPSVPNSSASSNATALAPTNLGLFGLNSTPSELFLHLCGVHFHLSSLT
ncbi:unnamed protein product [Protopolystoma xenopodis]|uniref:Uncharacterized protein n=1 Tax=Protopolystoma xenopodis TaxID=117903 RepID=A0A3S5CTH4_9PLAT|nr:unnamed protein product [Protopolystoma xenopodis]